MCAFVLTHLVLYVFVVSACFVYACVVDVSLVNVFLQCVLPVSVFVV